MRAADTGRLVASFARARWGTRFRDRAALERWQRVRIARFMRTVLPDAPFYRAMANDDLAALPVVDKRTMLGDFAAFNTRGITLATALAAAEAAERSGPRVPGFDPSLAAGLSSGTQGPRGVFLASPVERATWAGILLARTLNDGLLKTVLTRRAPLRVAFFLRANSALYTTLASRRIDFRFFDLHAGIELHAVPLAAFAPDVLVAPASVLAWLAATSPVRPRRVISVAEVLEDDDRATITAAFGTTVHQIYQGLEGFLGYTCEHGTLHLNEEFVHVEPEWLDAERTRFSPIVTDFTRRTQMVVRYRLDDVLRVGHDACRCGRVSRTLAAIDGRVDDILWFEARDGLAPLFPDALRHGIARCAVDHGDYRIEQQGRELRLSIAGGDAAFVALTAAIDRLVVAQRMKPWPWRRFVAAPRGSDRKRRRIVCSDRPTTDGERLRA